MPRPPRLLVLDPAGTRREVPLLTFPFRIGRRMDNDLVLSDSRISRLQAQIATGGGVYFLEDLGSRHGTRVNGEPIAESHPLQTQDRIDFSMPDSFKLVYLGDEATLDELIELVEKPAQTPPGARELYHLGVLLEVAHTMDSRVSLEEVLVSVVDAAVRLTHTERGVLLLADFQGTLKPVVARSAEKETIPAEDLQISAGVLNQVASLHREVIVSDMGCQPGIAQQTSVVSLSLLTVVAIPIEKRSMITALDVTVTKRESELVGVLYLDSRSPSIAFSDTDREVLRVLAREAATVIENAQLLATARAKARLDHEIEIASKFQQELLPKSFAQLPHLELAASTLACYQVGGDCFDVIELGEGRCGFFVADVSGKGIAASLLATLLQGVFYTTATLDIPLPEIAGRVNQYLYERSSDDRYATLFYGVLDPAGNLAYVNAGLVPPFVRRASGELVELGSANLPVGMFPGVEFVSARVSLAPGDFLIVYTDGVTEASNPAGEMFGDERLRSRIRGFNGGSAPQLADAVRGAVRDFSSGAPQGDDITLLVLKYTGTPS